MPSGPTISLKSLGNCSVLSFSTRHFLKALQEGHELVTRPVTTGLSLDRVCLGERLLFQREIRMEINLCRFYGFMAQPQGDDRTVDAVLQEVHGQAVTQHMGGDALVLQ